MSALVAGRTLLKERRKQISAVVIGTALVCLGFFVYRSWRSAALAQLALHPGWLAGSMVMAAVSQAAAVLVWWIVLRAVGPAVAYTQLLRVHFISNLTKYIPGTVWTYSSVVYLLNARGVPGTTAAVSLVAWQAVSAAAGILVSAALLPALAIRAQYVPIYGLLIAMVVLLFVASRPAALWTLVNKWLFRRSGIEISAVRFDLRLVALALAVNLLVWVMQGLAFFAFCNGVVSIPWMRLPAAIGAYALATTVGFVTPFAPAGLGVREGLLTVALAGVLPAGVPVIAALLSRIWLVAVELICVLGVLVVPGLTKLAALPGSRGQSGQLR